MLLKTSRRDGLPYFVKLRYVNVFPLLSLHVWQEIIILKYYLNIDLLSFQIIE